MSFDSFDISASGMYAQRVKLDTIASNIANANTTRNPDGSPGVYRKKQVVFEVKYNDVLDDYGIPEIKAGKPINPVNGLLKGMVSYDEPDISKGVSVVKIVEDTTTPLRKVHDPSHPDADDEGYVSYPNVNPVTEMVEMLKASRAYEASVTSIDTTKNIISAAMRI